MPILLEDLYPPPARAVYRGVRAWEQNLTSALGARDGISNAVLEQVAGLARACRRHLLLVQRLRYEITTYRDGPEADPRYDLWVRHRIGWSGDLAYQLERLALASRPFLDGVVVGRSELGALEQTMEAMLADIRTRNLEVSAALDD